MTSIVKEIVDLTVSREKFLCVLDRFKSLPNYMTTDTIDGFGLDCAEIECEFLM